MLIPSDRSPPLLSLGTARSQRMRIHAATCAAALVAVVAGASGCAHVARAAAQPACAAGDRAMFRDTLYFGRNRPTGGRVTEDEWADFLASEATPRFPDGFTVLSATGQWRDAGGKIEREASNVLVVLHDGSPATRQRIAALADAYRQRFGQEAVLRERSPACVAF